jgi:tetratricopeptide (TPR) repeat protein/transcriptional regulator with XRE-family HTH domain
MSDDQARAEIADAAGLGRELKRLARRHPGGPVKVAALARRLDISRSTLYAYLAGTTVPPAEVLDDLLAELAVPADERRRLTTARDAVWEAVRGPRAPAARQRIPLELPADPAGFTGRAAELAALDAVLAGSHRGAPVRIASISGIAGVGKTALAVHWGHRVAAGFPDGCLYADLLGYSPADPRDPADALAGFLRGLGVDGAGIPDDPHERAARFRSMLAGRRVLVLLDNALDVDQVRPLLPGGSSCFVVITSRADLAGLHVEPGAERVGLYPLPDDDAMALLRAHIGTHVGTDTNTDTNTGTHTDEARAAARELVRRCGGLPLALRIVAAHAADRRDRPLSELVADLAGQGLDLFDVGDRSTSIGTVFSWSVRHLTREAVADFCLLGAHTVRDVDVHAVAALLGTDLPAAARRADHLVRAHLVARSRGGRFDMHDLVRAYARERVATEVPAAGHDAALKRLVDHYAAAATRAMNVLHPAEPGAGDGDLSPAQARAWLDTEWPNLLTVVGHTARQGWPDLTTRMVTVLRRHLDQGGRHTDALTILGHALDASRQAGDRSAEGAALYDLGVANLRLGRHDEAMAHHRQALALCHAGGDRDGDAGALNNLGNLLERLGRYGDAMDHYRRALVLVRDLDQPRGEATLLTNLGVVHTRLGDYDQALRHGDQALAVFREVGDIGGAARTLGNLGEAHHLAGRHREALRLYDEALTLAREIGACGIEIEVLNHAAAAYLALDAVDLAMEHHRAALAESVATGDRYEQAKALEGLGHARQAAGERDLAATSWRESLRVYRQLGLREADRVETLLSITP